MKNSYASHKFKAVIKALTAVLLFLCSVFVSAQTYNIDDVSGQTISTCSGTFYDSGGSGGRYGSSEDYNVAFTSSNSMPIEINFTSWDVESSFWAGMRIYDGTDNTAPPIGTYDRNSPPGTVVSTNASNTLYVEFYSIWWPLFRNYGAGWEATISCARSGLLITNPHIYQKVKNN